MKKADSAARKRENANEYHRIVRGEEDDFYAIDRARDYYRGHARQMAGFAAALTHERKDPAPAENQQRSDTARAQEISVATRSLIGKLQESHREREVENLRREQRKERVENLRRELKQMHDDYADEWEAADDNSLSHPVYPPEGMAELENKIAELSAGQ